MADLKKVVTDPESPHKAKPVDETLPKKPEKQLVKLMLYNLAFALICTNLATLEQFWKPAFIYLASIRTPILDKFMQTMGYFGFEFFFILIPISCFAANFQNTGRKNSFGFDLLLILIYTWLIGSLIKTLFQRARPYQLFDDLVITPDHMLVLEFSFPSGHSCGSMISWTFLYDRLKEGKSKAGRRRLYWLTWAIVFLASASRVYYCVHYPHDIIGGWLLALIIYRLYSDWNVMLSVYVIFMIVVTMLIGVFTSDSELLHHMPGLVLCTCSLLSIAFCLVFANHLPLNSPVLNTKTPSSPIWKRALRVVIGLSIFVVLGFLRMFTAHLEMTIPLLVIFGFTVTLWLLLIAPSIFTLLRLY